MAKSFLMVSMICLLGSVSCTNMLYYPNDYKYVNEKALSYPPKDVELQVHQHKDILNWYFEPKPNTRQPVTIVFAHGNGQNMSAHYRSLYWILDEGVNLFAVGYPGYGPNSGSPTPENTVKSVIAAIEWVKINRPNDSIFLYGQSLGGNVMLRAFSDYPDPKVCAVAVEGTFASYKKAAQKTLSKSNLLWLFQWLPYLVIDDSKAIKNNIAKLPKSQYLVIHGEQDQAISINLGRQLFEELPDKKQFWAVKGGKHIDTFARHGEYRKKFVKFLKENCLKIHKAVSAN